MTSYKKSKLAILISLTLILLWLCLALSSCVTFEFFTPPWPSEYGEGTYEVWYANGLGMKVSTVRDYPTWLQGYYECDGERREIYIKFSSGTGEKDSPGCFDVYDLHTKELIHSGEYFCDESQVQLLPFSCTYDGKYLTYDILPLFDREEIILAKVSDTSFTDADTETTTENTETKE